MDLACQRDLARRGLASLHNSTMLTAAFLLGEEPLVEPQSAVRLEEGEQVFLILDGTELVSVQSRGGYRTTEYSGVSLPAAPFGGRSSFLRRGRSRSEYTPGVPTQVGVDIGVLTVTDRRAVFLGAQRSHECRFERLLALSHADDGMGGQTTFASSGSQHPMAVSYAHFGHPFTTYVAGRISLALGAFEGKPRHSSDYLEILMTMRDYDEEARRVYGSRIESAMRDFLGLPAKSD